MFLAQNMESLEDIKNNKYFIIKIDNWGRLEWVYILQGEYFDNVWILIIDADSYNGLEVLGMHFTKVDEIVMVRGASFEFVDEVGGDLYAGVGVGLFLSLHKLYK